VVFAATSSGGAGFFTQNAILALPGDIIDGKTLIPGFGSEASLNNSGDAAFIAPFLGGTGIFTQNSLLAQTGDTIGGKTLIGFGSNPSLNDNGDASFVGIFSDNTRGLVLAQTADPIPENPIPEPSTLLLFGSGLAGLGFFRMRRKFLPLP